MHGGIFVWLPYLSIDGLCELGCVPAAFCGVALPQRRQAAGDSHMSPPLAAAVICHIRRLPCYVRRHLLNAAKFRMLAWYQLCRLRGMDVRACGEGLPAPQVDGL